MALRFRLHPYLQQLNFLVLGISRALKYSSHVKLFFLYLAILVFNFTCFSCLNCFIITFIIYKISLYYYFKISSFISFYFFLLSFSGYSNYLFCSLSNCIFKINRSTFYFVVLLRLYFYVFSMSSISFFFSHCSFTYLSIFHSVFEHLGFVSVLVESLTIIKWLESAHMLRQLHDMFVSHH